MLSREYAKSLVLEADLSRFSRPCLLIIKPNVGEADGLDTQAQVIFLSRPVLRLGRDSNCHVPLQDPYISRVHATFTLTRQGSGISYWLADGDGKGKASANGVFANRRRIHEVYELKDRDQIRFGTRVHGSFHEVRTPTPEDHQEHQRIGELLVEAGLVHETQIQEVSGKRRYSQMLLGEILAQRGWVSWETVEFMSLLRRSWLPEISDRPAVGEAIKAAGLITSGQLTEALKRQKRQEAYFGDVLVGQGQIREQTLEFFLRRFSYLDEGSQNATLAMQGDG